LTKTFEARIQTSLYPVVLTKLGFKILKAWIQIIFLQFLNSYCTL